MNGQTYIVNFLKSQEDKNKIKKKTDIKIKVRRMIENLEIFIRKIFFMSFVPLFTTFKWVKKIF